MQKRIDPDFMPPLTAKIFDKLSRIQFMNKYTIVGGTALSLQIKHRLSEDLDFIYDGEELNVNSIKRNIAKNFSNYRITRIDEKYQIDFIIDQTRVTFFTTSAVTVPFNVQKYSFPYRKINIASVDIIAVLKMGALAQRNTIRDYYDLYYLAKNIKPLGMIISDCKQLLPGLSPVTYSETLVYTDDLEEDDISGHLKPAVQINKQEISAFFIEELKKIKDL